MQEFKNHLKFNTLKNRELKRIRSALAPLPLWPSIEQRAHARVSDHLTPTIHGASIIHDDPSNSSFEDSSDDDLFGLFEGLDDINDVVRQEDWTLIGRLVKIQKDQEDMKNLFMTFMKNQESMNKINNVEQKFNKFEELHKETSDSFLKTVTKDRRCITKELAVVNASLLTHHFRIRFPRRRKLEHKRKMTIKKKVVNTEDNKIIEIENDKDIVETTNEMRPEMTIEKKAVVKTEDNKIIEIDDDGIEDELKMFVVEVVGGKEVSVAKLPHLPTVANSKKRKIIFKQRLSDVDETVAYSQINKLHIPTVANSKKRKIIFKQRPPDVDGTVAYSKEINYTL